MNDKSIVLSISMLISGKKDMPKSLESLLFFKNAIPCEIILVDTGCNAEQRALAEQYADKIYDFTWCNDFAAARNVGLKAAKGEWFLYLDDDEWFDNPQEIIEFFQSGEYKNYNCASYTVRNYTDSQGIMYDDSYPSRMVKLEPETRFVGKIHEYLEPFRLPKKTFSDFVHHYGYVYKNEEESRKHAQRNIVPLLEMRKTHPGDPRWICQLVQEYFSVHEYEEVVKACKIGLNEWNEKKDSINYAPSHVGAIYGYLLISLESLEQFEEEEFWLKKAMAEPINNLNYMEPTIAFYCLVAARLYSKTGRHELCRKYFQRYIDYTKRLKDDRTAIEAGAALIAAGVFQEQLLYGVTLMSMESAIRMEDYALCEEAFYLMNWDDRRLLHQVTWEKKMLDAFCSVKYHPVWVKLLQTLVSREDGIKEMHVVFLEAEINYKQQGEMEKLWRLHRLVSELDYEHRYILCTKILWTEHNPDISSEEERRQSVMDLYNKVFEKYTDEIFEVKAEVWNVAERMKISLEPMLLQVDYRRWNRILVVWSADVKLADLQQWDTRMALWKQKDDIRYEMFTVKCLEGYLRYYQDICPSMPQLEEMLWRYADNVLILYRYLYKDSVFTEIPEALPEEAQLALRIKKMQKYRELGDDRKALACLRKCVGLYPVLEKLIEAYATMYRDTLQKQNQDASADQKEFLQLVNSLKSIARQHLTRKEYQEARDILLQIRQCVPEDEEIEKLLSEADNGLGVENDIWQA